MYKVDIGNKQYSVFWYKTDDENATGNTDRIVMMNFENEPLFWHPADNQSHVKDWAKFASFLYNVVSIVKTTSPYGRVFSGLNAFSNMDSVDTLVRSSYFSKEGYYNVDNLKQPVIAGSIFGSNIYS